MKINLTKKNFSQHYWEKNFEWKLRDFETKMSTFCAKIGEFSYFLWNSSKSPPFRINPTHPHLKKSLPPFRPKIPQNGINPSFWPHCWTVFIRVLNQEPPFFPPKKVKPATTFFHLKMPFKLHFYATIFTISTQNYKKQLILILF